MSYVNGTPNQIENGRSYHGYRRGLYMYPNDEREQDRMDIFHKMFLVARRNELHRAPITRNYLPQRILDLGTGTGIWAIDMADKYPDAEVIGVDLSLIQPKWIPRNLRFQISDFESEWTLGKDSFDLIHLRLGIGSISSYPTLFRRVYEHLKPSYGWFEYVDIDLNIRSDDGSLTPHHAIYQWQSYLFEATERSGKPLRYEQRTGQVLREAGFVDIQEVVIKLPINPWPAEPFEKEVGRWFNLGLTEGLEATSLGPFTRVMGWSKQDVDAFLTPVMKECKQKSIHGYCTMHIWMARRGP